MGTRTRPPSYETVASSSSRQGSFDNVQVRPFQTSRGPASSPISLRGADQSDLFANDVTQSTPSSQQSTSTPAYSIEAVSTPSSSNDQQKKKIPRPPNAWILYRSAKVKEKDVDSAWNSPQPWHDFDLPTPSSWTPISGPSSSKSTWPVKSDSGTDAVEKQSMMSRRVADMWRAETEEVKNQYYELAKRKKEEHERMYPGYRYKPSKEPRSKAKVEKDSISKKDGIKIQAKKSRTANEVEGERPASTAKTKGRGSLYIDVDAAEKEAPYNSILDIPFSAILGRPSSTGPSSSYFGLGTDALDEATTVVDRLLQQSPYLQECTTTSGLGTSRSSAWMASPLPLTPADGGKTASNSDLPTEPWTAWIMDKPMSADPATPVNTHNVISLTAPLTEPPPMAKGKKAKKVGFAKADSRVRNTARRKSTSNAGSKHQATSSSTKTAKETEAAASGSTASLQKKFKKAILNQEYVKATMAKRDEAKSATVKSSEGDDTAMQETIVEQTINSTGDTLDILLKSYDRDGVDSEVEEALLCADTMIESFANMAAWSPDQGWFAGLPHSAPAISNSAQSVPTLDPSSWTLYSQPAQETQDWTAALQIIDTQMLDQLQCDTEEAPLMPQILPPSSFAPSAELDDVVQAASRRLAEWDQMDDDQVKDLEIPTNLAEEDWTLNEQEWDALLTQAIFDPSFSQSVEQRSPAPTSNTLDTPPESVWDLIHFDSLSQARSVDTRSYCGESVRSTSDIPSTSPLYSSSTTTRPIREAAPVIELHGSYTEEELREKLRQLTKGNDRPV